MRLKALSFVLFIVIFSGFAVSQEDESDGPEGDNEDPWAKVDFGSKDLDNIIGIIDRQYYQKNYNRNYSWEEAANYALLFSVKNHAMEILPESFYKEERARVAALKKDPNKAKNPLSDYEEEYEGKTFKLDPQDKFIVREIPKDNSEIEEVASTTPHENKDKKDTKEAVKPEVKATPTKEASKEGTKEAADSKESGKKKKRKLNDEELQALDKLDKEKWKRKHDAWDKIQFTRVLFDRVANYLKTTYAGKQEFILDRAGKPGKKKELIFEEKKMWIYAASGYLVSLDPHSSIISRYAWEKSTQSLEDSSFDGIGAVLVKKDDYTMIENPLEEQPAAKAGLNAGDIILKVDGVSTYKMLLQDVVKRIKGPRDTKVRLLIERPGQPEPFEAKVTRAHIELKNVKSKMLSAQDKIGYIKLTGFIESSYDSVVQHFRDLEKEAGGFGQLKGLVFDLRNNSGGLLEQSAKIADLFIHRGKIVTVKYGSGREDVHRARSPDITRSPIIVLVNALSASASEIMASAIQDQKRGLIIGERTFGKASVQQLIPNSALNHTYYTKITIARYFAPSGRTIQVIGVKPDIEVAPEFAGKIPYRFREENYAGHLSQLSTDYDLPNKELVSSLETCVQKTGQTEKTVKNNPNPQIKHDNQLLVSLDYMRCWINPNLVAETTSSGTNAKAPAPTPQTGP